MQRSSRFLACLLVAPLALAACGSDNDAKPVDAGVPDGPQGPIVGGRLGAAIKSAEAASSARTPAKGKSDGSQPPETGVFPPGEADKVQAPGAPPKVDVISDGDGNKVQLATKMDLAEQKVTLTVGVRVAQQRTPSIDVALSIKPEKKKDEKPAEGKDAAAAPLHLAATVTGAALPSTQGVSKEAVDQLGKLKGTIIHYDLAPGGVASGFTLELPKGAGEGLDLILDALVDSISAMTVVLPSKPVGVGAYWIVADRAKAAVGITPGGLPTVRYRVFKVTKIEGDAVTLSIDLRQYAAEQTVKVEAQGQKQEMPLEALDAQGKGTVVWTPNGVLPVSGDLKPQMTMGLAAPGAPPGRGPRIQVEVTAQITGPTKSVAESGAEKK